MSAVPVGPVAESLPGGRFYLKKPKLSPDAGEDELPLQVENTAYRGKFQFGERNSFLFRDEVDDSDYMYNTMRMSLRHPRLREWRNSRSAGKDLEW